jgi:hypothetical protein
VKAAVRCAFETGVQSIYSASLTLKIQSDKRGFFSRPQTRVNDGGGRLCDKRRQIASRGLSVHHRMGMDRLIACATLKRLKREYEAAIRVWGELEFPLLNAPVETEAARIALLLRKQDVLDARNAAGKRLVDHKASCRICKNRS